MRAPRYNDDPSPSAPALADRIRVVRGADNDNGVDVFDSHDDAPFEASDVSRIVPRGPSWRVWGARALAAALLAVGVLAVRHATAPAAPDGPPPVTVVDIASRAVVVPAQSPQPVLLALAPTHAARRHHGGHVLDARDDVALSLDHAPRAVTPLAPAMADAPATEASPRNATPPALATIVGPAAVAPSTPSADGTTAAEPTRADDGESPDDVPDDSADQVVERAVDDHGEDVDACIQDAPDEASGRVVVDLVIGRDGAVRSATPHGPDALRDVGRCLARAMSSWRMEVPDARGDTRISWPFTVESNAD